MKTVKMFMLCLMMLSLISLCFSLENPNKKSNKSGSYFFSSSSSSFYSSSNGEKGRHQKMNFNEEFREKNGDSAEEVRKYEESFKKDNDAPAEIKKKAETNVEEERKIFGDQPSIEYLQKDKANNYLRNFLNDSSHLRHDKYDKFLSKREENLIKSVSNSNSKGRNK